jgi:23S rRNA pseudouridine2605 synthase
MNTSVRLNKFLALQLGISRREADELIEKGRVRIGSSIATLGDRATPTDIIYVDNKKIDSSQQLIYVLFNKPIGYVCSRRKQGETPTIYDILPKEYYTLKPVGRLDKDSSGLLILTNDGDFAHKMTHPSFKKTKVYEISLDKPLEPLHQQLISDRGIELEDGTSKFLVAKINENTYQITMQEGRNRQIRRTFTALGYTVKRLHRVQFGPYLLDTQPTHHKLLTKLL